MIETIFLRTAIREAFPRTVLVLKLLQKKSCKLNSPSFVPLGIESSQPN